MFALLQPIIFLLSALLHPYYVSVTEIKCNPEQKRTEISTRIFYDDLEKAINKTSPRPINLLKPQDRKEVNRLVSEYLKQHLILKTEGKTRPMTYIGYEIEEEAAWCYFEIPGLSNAKEVAVMNDVLFELYPSQINMIHVIVKGKRQSRKLDNPDNKVLFKF